MTAALSAKINELSRAGKYSEALVAGASTARKPCEKKYGALPSRCARVGSLNNLARSRYQTEGRTIECAYRSWRRMIASGRAQASVAVARVLFAARWQQSMPSDKAFDDAR